MTQAPPAKPPGPTAMPALTPDLSFDAASRLVLEYLKANVSMALWGVTRVENGRQTFVTLDEANAYGVPAGGGHPWEESFCIRMVAGNAPAVAPDAQAIAAYAAAVKSTGVVARLGGDEFGVLLRWCTQLEAVGVTDRMYAALGEAGVAGSIGWAPITVLKGFPAALAEADQAMYAAKAARRAARLADRPAP